MTDEDFWKDFEGFPGFKQPGYTQIPDIFLDKVLSRLKESELKLLLYVFRHTFGYGKDIDEISMQQLTTGVVQSDGERIDHGTGLTEVTIYRAVKSLEEKKLIVVERKRYDERTRRKVNRYRVRFEGEGEKLPIQIARVANVGGNKKQGSTKKQNGNEQPSVSSGSIPNDKTPLALAAEFAPDENPQAIVKYLDRFPNGLLEQAAVITRQSANAKNPVAYLYGVVQRLSEQESVKPLAQQRGEALPELSEAEYSASLQALERVKQEVAGSQP